MNMPNISGIRVLSKAPIYKTNKRLSEMAAPPVSTRLMKPKSDFGEEVDMLMNSYNDKAFLYNSGKVDIIKQGNIKTIKFKSKKMASLYLMKVGWKYV